MISSLNIFVIILSFFAVGGLGSLLCNKKDHAANLVAGFSAMAGSIWGLIFSLSILISGSSFSLNLLTTFPQISISFLIDDLSAFFVLIISTVALLSTIYGMGYVKQYYNHYNVGALGFFYNFFIAGMLLVVTANNGVFFLIAWEIMSLTSYFLVIFEFHNDTNVKAGSLYLIMTHVGTACLIFLFLILYRETGSFDFTIIKDRINVISPFLQNLLFLMALIGFGTKAGLIPLHIWLPGAHPAAPSHVSALMSGVMIKTAIYMFIRLFFDVISHVPIWWGALILMMGSASALLGVLYAISEHDIKRLLAYHSIENIGIILLGLGSSLIFLSLDLKAFALLGIVAALYHTLNHAIFKALLFLGAGAVISQTHTRNIEEYGGLIKYMPQTALLFLIGSMAISALPPLNGFFSEWLTFQSLFNGLKAPSILTKGIFLLAAGSLALTGGLAAACFVKVFGATFLARPRSEEVKHAKEAGLSLRLGMSVLASLTLLLGIFAGPATQIITKIAQNLKGLSSAENVISSQFTTVRIEDFASVSIPQLFVIMVLATVFVTAVIYSLTKNQKVKTGATWDCGTNLTPRMEITATGFSRSIITIFKGILKPTKQTEIDYHDSDIRYFPKANIVTLGIHDIYKTHFYEPLQDLILKISDHTRKIQSGNINLYIFYIFITLIGLLMVMAII